MKFVNLNPSTNFPEYELLAYTPVNFRILLRNI